MIPEEIAKVHRTLMLKFFDRVESTVLNKIRDLIAVDKDSYLIPIMLFVKILPFLSNGLKMVGLIKKSDKLSFPPLLPPEF